MVTLFVQNNIQNTRTQNKQWKQRYRWKRTRNTQWKQRYRWKRYRSMTLRNVRYFPPASGRMTPINVCLWRHREHCYSNKRWRQRRFEPSQETGVKKMINGNLSSEFISLWFANVHGAASSIKNCVSPLVLRLQKVQERLLCKTYSLTTSHPAVHMLRQKWQFQFGNTRNITKNSNFKRHFLENGWSYRREILHDNLEDQVKWHISKMCSFL